MAHHGVLAGSKFAHGFSFSFLTVLVGHEDQTWNLKVADLLARQGSRRA
jgi:hypothetical protein